MSTYTLLFVDDEVDIVDSLHRSFRKGYRTLKATSGAEAIKILAEQTVDLIVCDQRMPEISGDQVLKYALEQQPEAIRILLTGYADTDSLMRCINDAQIYKYISKPWEPEMLRLTVVRALESQELSKQKQLVTNALTQYVSSKVVEQIMVDPSRLQLGGERKTLSILFSDLEGFTDLAERMEPEPLTALLNDYLTEMTNIILDEGGTLDKYQGDGIVAFWNAPLDQADHAVCACRAALRCQQRLAERADDFAAQAGGVLKARIGLHTGEVVVGNMGSKIRFDYSILGDAANLASRLESANKLFGTAIMVSEATWLQAGGSNNFIGREIGMVKVAGRSAPVKVFELQGQAGTSASPDMTAYRQALDLCRAGIWIDAEAAFNNWPDDSLCQAYAKQCRKAQEQSGWDGVWLMDNK
ncbi:adenylate/guanylate cyclase domain-containing protein [Candidatus Methylobacter oryzae]|uniref:Adenylate/guanylate cyclase domain-containing response regulator n=1 Tax=Candidatus Methylobacter oryzae TaxID=2497749 RepID=A0ABY3CDH5_9GAMM|nr:adenylate/guanylate cyclase domain-containing protein [Candidatus Methylobacter oryzae]TRX00706.1 adenylate/guanylate cyclase domain-containing response regulator [Candidatus Methylobacter oryzae]